MSKPIIYVAAGSYSECLQYQAQVPEVLCLYITDVEFLRGRAPADIKVLPLIYEKWDAAGILESVETHKRMWKQELEEQSREDEGTDDLYF